MNADILLGILAVVMAGFMVYGLTQGFLRVIFSLSSSIVSLILVYNITPALSDFLMENTDLLEKARSYVSEAVSAAMGRMESADSLPYSLISGGFSGGISGGLADGFAEGLSEQLAVMVIRMGSFLAAFLVISIIMKIVLASLDLISRIPVLHGINRILGLLAGMVEGFLAIWLFMLFMTMIAGSDAGRAFFGMVNSNSILALLYSNNVFLKIFTEI